jgi:hypothetical protein
MMKFTPFAIALIASTALAGCKKEAAPPPPVVEAPAPPAVAGITLGSAIGANKTVTAARDTFGLRDTVYVSVATSGTGDNQKLMAHWRKGAEAVMDDSLTVNLAGPAVSEFHIARPRAWAAGQYSVTVSLNSDAATTKSFVIR